MEPLLFYQVLIFRDWPRSRELGLPLWAAFKEVESLNRYDGWSAGFRRFYLSKEVPEEIRSEVDLDWEKISRTVGSAEFWVRMRGTYHATFNKELLCDAVRELLGPEAIDVPLLVVTDQEITPPPTWRYIVWDSTENGSVVSIAPTDPLYWGVTESDRVSIIKHRVRTACISAVGEMLGLEHCTNPRCFLNKPITSVNQLDYMVCFGREHKLPELVGKGFLPWSHHPSKPQSVEEIPSAELA